MYLPLCYGEEVSGRKDGWMEWDGMDGMGWDVGACGCVGEGEGWRG